MNKDEFFNTYSEDEIIEIREYIETMIDAEGMESFINFLRESKNGINAWDKYKKDRADELDETLNEKIENEEEKDPSQILLNIVSDAMRGARTEKIWNQEEEMAQDERVKELKKIWDVINFDQNTAKLIAESLRELQYDLDSDVSKIRFLVNLINLHKLVPINNIDDEQIIENWLPIKEAMSELIEKLTTEDFMLFYTNIYASDFFADKAFFKVAQKQIEKMDDYQYIKFMHDMADGQDGYEGTYDLIHIDDNKEKDTMVVQTKIRKRLDSKIPLVHNAYLYETYKSGMTDEEFSDFPFFQKVDHLFNYRKKIYWDYHPYQRYESEEEENEANFANDQNFIKSRGYATYIKILRNLGEFDFVRALIGYDKTILISTTEEEEQIFKSKITDLSDESIIILIFQESEENEKQYFNYLDFVQEEALKRNLVDIDSEEIKVDDDYLEQLDRNFDVYAELGQTGYLKNFYVGSFSEDALSEVYTDNNFDDSELVREYREKISILKYMFDKYKFIGTLDDFDDKKFFEMLSKRITKDYTTTSFEDFLNVIKSRKTNNINAVNIGELFRNISGCNSWEEFVEYLKDLKEKRDVRVIKELIDFAERRAKCKRIQQEIYNEWKKTHEEDEDELEVEDNETQEDSKQEDDEMVREIQENDKPGKLAKFVNELNECERVAIIQRLFKMNWRYCFAIEELGKIYTNSAFSDAIDLFVSVKSREIERMVKPGTNKGGQEENKTNNKNNPVDPSDSGDR